MRDEIFHKLAGVLDTLPNGFPTAENGVEIKLLKKIFTPEEADLFCDLRLTFETAEQISQRTGRPLDGLEEKLINMGIRGEVFSIDFAGTRVFRIMPWAFGIFEFILPRMDRELAELCEEYMETYGREFFKRKPQLMQAIPIERELPNIQEALSYEQISNIIENSKSFGVQECICRKEKHLLGKGCDKPLELCTTYAPIPGVFDNHTHIKSISKEEAYELLDKADEAGLVHLTYNKMNEHIFICNCCGCCCGVLRNINEFGIKASDVINSYYYAEIDPDECTVCGTCVDERCQVKAIEEGDDFYSVIKEKCIGCGLCISTCPSEAIKLVRKPEEEIESPPVNEDSWYEERANERGIDYSRYK